MVEDDEDNADLLKDLVENHGHRAVVVHDGSDALDSFHRDRPDVVLLDIGLPGIDGLSVAKAMRSRTTRPIRIVAITGFANSHGDALAAGFDSVLVKPCKAAAIKDELRAAGRYESQRLLATR